MNGEKERKLRLLVIKIFILTAVLLGVFFGLKHMQVKRLEKLQNQSNIQKLDNVETEIFDVKGADSHDQIEEITQNELSEKGAEFIYQTLLRNQSQILDLKEQIKVLNDEFTKYKNHEKLAKIIFVYLDLRQKFFSGSSYKNELKSFEMTSINDVQLQDKISKLSSLLQNFQSSQSLSKSFVLLIPEIIATKNHDPNGNLIEKIRHNLSKMITIRKIGGDAEDIDLIVSDTEKFLKNEEYQHALDGLVSLDQRYHKTLSGFLVDLTNSLEVQKLDQEILNYLKSLS